MSIPTELRPVSYLKSKSADLLKQAYGTHRSVIITQNSKPKSVLQNPESYKKMCNAIGLLKLISLSEEDIKNNNSRKCIKKNRDPN